MYATDGQTDKQADKSNAYCPLTFGWGHNNIKFATDCLVSTAGLNIVVCVPVYIVHCIK